MRNDAMERRLQDNLKDVERLARYYGKTADRQQKKHLGLSLLSVFGSIAAAAWLLSPAEDAYGTAVSAGLFLVVALATSVMIVYDFSRRAQIARATSEQVREIGVELGRLWHSDLDDNEIRTAIESLESRIYAVTRNDLPVDDKLNEQYGGEAERIIEKHYSRAGDTRGGGMAAEA